MRRPSRVVVRRPDPVTGELIEEVVGARHFRSSSPPRPRLRQPPRRSGPGAVGVGWLAVHELRERELLYWLGHGHRLTPRERSAIAEGIAASVIRPVEPEWEPGEVLDVVHQVSVQVLETTWLKRRVGGPFDVDLQYRTTLKIKDDRPLLLRRGVLGSGAGAVDAAGEPLPPTAVELEQARVDSAYTTSPSRSVDGAGEEIDESLHRRLHRHQPAATAARQAKLTRVERIRKVEERIERASAKHERKMVRMLERQLRSLRNPRDNAA